MTAAPSVRVSEAFPPGFIIVDKPPGQTSFAMVALLRRLTGVRRIGHAGTLDPMATGVLPVAIGDATRLIEYMDDETKVYAANVRFGVSTDTYDAEGEVVAEADASGVTAASVEGLLPAFTGDVVQRPPSYSAIKVGGKPLYRYAREGGAVQAAERVVRIESIALVAFEHPVARLEVRCGKGTYIRSLAHDLGQRVGCGAHLSALRRAESGGFTLSDAHSIERVEAAANAGELERLLLAPDRVLERQPAAVLGDERRQLLVDGRDLPLGGPGDGGICRAYSTEGAFIGVLRRTSSGAWHPEKVLASAR